MSNEIPMPTHFNMAVSILDVHSHATALAWCALLWLFFINQKLNFHAWISTLRIWTAQRTNVIKLKFQLHRQYPSPTSTLDLYFSSMIPFISMLWLCDSINLSNCFNGRRGRTHWILLSSKVYFGHSWLYIWYNSAYIYFRRRYRKRPITPLLRWGEPSLHLTHKSLFDLPTTKVCDLSHFMLCSGAHGAFRVDLALQNSMMS